MNYLTAVDACAAYGEGATNIVLQDDGMPQSSSHPPLAGGLLAAPNTAEVLDLLHSTLNSDQVDDFWVGIDDM